MAYGDHLGISPKTGLFCSRCQQAPCNRSCRDRYGQQLLIHPCRLQYFAAPAQLPDIERHRPGCQGIVDLRHPGQSEDDIIFHQKDMPGCLQDLRPVPFQPHDFGDAVHLVGAQPCDLRDFLFPYLPYQLKALFPPPWIRVQHGRVQRLTGPVHTYECLAEAGYPNPANVRIPGRHLRKRPIDAVHHGRNIDFMSSHCPAHRIVAVCLPKQMAVPVKNRALASRSPDVQSRNIHSFSPFRSSV